MSENQPNRDAIVTRSGRILSTLNWLRAGVLGANDGIVSTAALIFGVAGASASHATIMLAATASVAAGALSMAAGATPRIVPIMNGRRRTSNGTRSASFSY